MTPSQPSSARDAVDVFEQALTTLDSTWTVHAAPRIGLDRPDFIAIHDRFGVCIINVVDWTPETTCVLSDGQIGVLSGDGTWSPVALDPRVKSARSRSAIFDQFFAMPEHGASPTAAVRSVLVLPAFTTVAAGGFFPRAENERAGLVGIWGSEAAGTSIGDVVRGLGCQPPPTASIEKLHRHVAAKPSLPQCTAWDPATPQVIVDIAENTSGRRHRRIDGAVGSGKSSALAARAARLAADGKQVLALSFNVTFASGLRSMVDRYCAEIGSDPTLVSCTNFHSFCTRVVSDAELAGARPESTRNASWTVGIVEKVTDAYIRGWGPRFDAVLIDEGQDFTDRWWDLLHDHVLVEGGETMLTVDRTQDIYDRTDWLDDRSRIDSLDVETLVLSDTLRAPADLLALTNEFATSKLDGTLQLPTASSGTVTDRGTLRRWGNVARVNDIGAAVGQEVVELLRRDPTLRPRDVAFICDYHHDGVRAAAYIERAGIPVHHIFSRDPDDPRRRRKHRFWTGAAAVKGCTVHSFKGWDASVVVLGIGADSRAHRLAYVAMTRVRRPLDRAAIVSVVNADVSLHSFGERFVAGSAPIAAPSALRSSAGFFPPPSASSIAFAPPTPD